MPWSQADLDAINSAIASGAKRVRFQTHEVEYQSVGDLLKAREMVRAEVEATSSTSGLIYTEYTGGF